MIIDNHVHTGWFTDGYHTAKDVWYSAKSAGIDGVAVSSTSTCAERYKDVVRELRELKRLGGERVHPVLWLTPTMMKRRYALPYMLRSKVDWQGVKMHWEAHPEWAHNAQLVSKALEVARRMDVPVLLHTGAFDTCHAGLFLELVCDNSDLTFVLAHARPVDEAIEALKHCQNVYVDLAFVPMADLQVLLSEGFADRILFGTDAPINKVFYPDISTDDYIKQQIENVRQVCGPEADKIFGRCVYHKGKKFCRVQEFRRGGKANPTKSCAQCR